jgi:hypothetical protein
MNLQRLITYALTMVVFSYFASTGQAQQRDLLTSRPCGPDSMTGPLRRLIPQGAFGADFRPACVAHDACYDTPYSNRGQCDAQYLQNMYTACEQSRHPALCRKTARAMAKTASRFGEKSFVSAQKIALSKL